MATIRPRRPRTALAVAVALLGSSGCGGDDASTLEPRHWITVAPTTISASAPGEIVLVATIEGRAPTPVPMRWQSLAPTIVALDTTTLGPHRVVARVLQRGTGAIVVSAGTATVTVPVTAPATSVQRRAFSDARSATSVQRAAFSQFGGRAHAAAQDTLNAAR